jgi:hypothetical protein
MSENQTIELNDAHRWLPPETFQDLGIVKADDSDLTITRNLPRVLQESSTAQWRRTSIIITIESYQTIRTEKHPPPPPPQCKQQVYKGSDNTKTMKTWTLLCNDRVMKRAINLPRFALAKQQLTVLRPRKQSKRGTGVFLPRAEAYN